MNLTLPLSDEAVKKLKAGDSVTLSGLMYTGRDAAHKRMWEAIKNGRELPFPIEGQTIYYVGPCPAKEGMPIGSCGPTTSYRMDAYAPLLIEHGLAGMIGKGDRDKSVVDAMKKYGAVYFGAIGGAGALLADHVVSSKVVAYEDLGTEAVRELYVKDFPLTVVIDSHGTNLYETGRKEYEINN